MIKRFTLLIIIFTLILVAPASAAEPGEGIIEGRIVNGTEGDSGVANQETILKTYLNDAEVNSATTITDAEGYFVFDQLLTDAGYSYQVTVNFQEAEYNSEWLTFDDGETTKSTVVTVYDATESDEAIRVEMAHTIIYVEPDSLLVEEYLFFINEVDRTYIGSQNPTTGEPRETLRFSLPEGITELQPAFGLMECCITGSEDGFVDTMPFLPGGKEVVYSYRVYHDSGKYNFSHRVNYPVTNFTLLIQGEGVKVASNQLTPQEPLNIEGVQFNHLSGTNLDSGDVISVELSGLSGTNNQGIMIWVVLALITLTGGFGFVYLLRKRRLQTVSSERNLEQIYQGKLAELAQLDDDFEDGKIDEASYHRLRAEKKSQLMVLMKRGKEKSGH
ncbi:MAG: hypothetical protein ACE5KP_04065 [Dehalococcoidales bacterium]